MARIVPNNPIAFPPSMAVSVGKEREQDAEALSRNIGTKKSNKQEKLIQCPLNMRAKFIRWHVTDYAIISTLDSIATKEHDRWWADNTEVFV